MLSSGLGGSIGFTSVFSSFCNFKRDLFPFFFGCGSSSSITVTTSGSTGFTSDAAGIKFLLALANLLNASSFSQKAN